MSKPALKKIYDKVRIKRPSIIEIDGGVTIFVDSDNNVTITGQNKTKIATKDNLELSSNNINIKADNDIRIRGKKVYIN